MLAWIVSFLIAAAVIAWAGWRLIQAVDLIAERTGLGRVFLGMILVATITSLPELATGISAVVVAQAPDIAVGDVIGSCVFNLLLFAVADAASPKLAFYGSLRPSHNLTAAFGVVLLGVLAIAILAPGGADSRSGTSASIRCCWPCFISRRRPCSMQWTFPPLL